MSDNREHLACLEVVRLVSDYLDGHVEGDVQSLFEEHLNYCLGCERYVDQLRETTRVTGLLHDEGGVTREVRDALRRAFDERTGA
jgi:predicted anti-sigma-YlaC factor YlaD